MKNIILLFLILFSFWCCTSTKKINSSSNQSVVKSNDTVRIANDSLEYEIIIIDVGFNSWLVSRAQPRKFYSQSYLEARNRFWVMEWNNRVLNPTRYNPNLYEMTIDYQSNINYGYEVNYLLFNYMTYFQLTNRQQFGGFNARI